MNTAGLGGVAATSDYVIVSDRELNDSVDTWRCFAADTGKPLWSVRNPAPGMLDYGNSPRATPVIVHERAYLFGAFGHLTCVKLDSGEVGWETNLKDEYEPEAVPKWGTCSTPLIIEDRVIVNPGAKDASLVALDAKSGKQLWKTPGKAAGYGSLITMSVRGKTQIIGHDAVSLGGWDPASGQRLWTLVPEKPNDFNVPTPIVIGDQLLVVTENNGTRLYDFDDAGKLKPKPVALNRKLVPDTHTPVVTAGRVFGLWRRLYCLDLANGLKELWSAEGDGFAKYGALVADDLRVLAITMTGELILFDAKAAEYTELARLKVLEGETGLYSHPALVKNRIYIRGSNSLVACVL
ncbi:PQQ-like beta-propeller repeat protein [soil metagenome]